jgi:hypothetical protein
LVDLKAEMKGSYLAAWMVWQRADMLAVSLAVLLVVLKENLTAE